MKRLQELIGRQPAAIVWLPDWAERLAMAGISAGNLDVEVPGTAASGEIGAMARSVEKFRQGLIESARLATEVAERDRAEQA